MLIELPEVFSQRDPRWKAKRLGTSNVTIGGYGCLLTCCAMLARWYGKDTNPAILNEDLKRVGGYSNDNLYNWWGGLTRVYNDITVLDYVNVETLNFGERYTISAALRELNPVIIEVDILPLNAKWDQHFVLAIGDDGSDIQIADPWTGTVQSLKLLYLNKIKKLVTHSCYGFEPSLDMATLQQVFDKVIRIEEILGACVTKDDLKIAEEHLQGEVVKARQEVIAAVEQSRTEVSTGIGEVKTQLSGLEPQQKTECVLARFFRK